MKGLMRDVVIDIVVVFGAIFLFFGREMLHEKKVPQTKEIPVVYLP